MVMLRVFDPSLGDFVTVDTDEMEAEILALHRSMQRPVETDAMVALSRVRNGDMDFRLIVGGQRMDISDVRSLEIAATHTMEVYL